MSSAALGRHVCGFARPAAGVGASAGGPALPPGGLFSLTQVTFQPFPLPSSALSSAQPMGGVVVREGGSPTTFSGQPQLPPSLLLASCAPLHPTCRSWAGLCSVVGPLPCLPAVRLRGVEGGGGRLCTSPGRLQHRLCLPAGAHSLSSLHQCALWTGNSPGSEEWLLPHPSPVGRKGHKAGWRGREVQEGKYKPDPPPSAILPALQGRPPAVS